MGAILHSDVQVTDTQGQRELVREVNDRLRNTAEVVTNNYRSPVALPFQAGVRNGPLWVPQESFSLLSIALLAPASVTPENVLSSIDVTGTPASVDATLPLTLTGGTPFVVNFTPSVVVGLGDDVALNFSTLNASHVAVSLNVQRMG